MSKLRDALRERNPSLLTAVEHQVSQATPQLWHTYATFPSGTKHTPEHTHTVEMIASGLLPRALLDVLSDDEIALLILACHYHDLGMSGTEEDNLTPESRDRVRREHAVSIGDRILEHWQALGFASEKSAQILASICRGHRPTKHNGVATWDDLPEFGILGPNRDVRIRVVSAMIYAADELHIGEDRAPRREEEFNKIANAESLRHWRRHQAVQGPVTRGAEMCFEGDVFSMDFERDLRKTLRKAFQSVIELKEQLVKSDVHLLPASIRFTWNRRKLWQLMAAGISSDLVARSAEELGREVKAKFEGEVADSDDLSSLCRETVACETLPNEIDAAVQELITREFFARVESGESCKYMLDGQPRTAQFLFQRAKDADEVDRLFARNELPQHEYRLFQSEFGRRYIRDVMQPRLRQDYHVDVVESPTTQYLKTSLEASPTAAHIVQVIRPPQSVLVHSDLLEFATIAGVCADLINDPELILDQPYRHAVTSLFEAGADRLPKFLLFIEELAIIKKLKLQQVFDAISPSKAEMDAHRGKPFDPELFTKTLITGEFRGRQGAVARRC